MTNKLASPEIAEIWARWHFSSCIPTRKEDLKQIGDIGLQRNVWAEINRKL